MAMQVKRVGLIKHEIWCDNIWEYLSLWFLLLASSSMIVMGAIYLIKLLAA